MSPEQQQKLISLNCEEIELFWESFLSSQSATGLLYNYRTDKVEFGKVSVTDKMWQCRFKVSGVTFSLVLDSHRMDDYLDLSKTILEVRHPSVILRTAANQLVDFLNSTGLYKIESVKDENFVAEMKNGAFNNVYYSPLLADEAHVGFFIIENYEALNRELEESSHLPAVVSAPPGEKLTSEFSLKELVSSIEETFDDIKDKIGESKPSATTGGFPFDPVNPLLLSNRTIDKVKGILSQFAVGATPIIQKYMGNAYLYNLEVANVVDITQPTQLDNANFTIARVKSYDKHFFFFMDNEAVRKMVISSCGGTRSHKEVDYDPERTRPLSIGERQVYLHFIKEISSLLNVVWPELKIESGASFQKDTIGILQKSVQVYMNIVSSKPGLHYTFYMYFPMPLCKPIFRDTMSHKVSSNRISTNLHNITIPMQIKFKEEPVVQAWYLTQLRENVFIPLSSHEVVVTEKSA